MSDFACPPHSYGRRGLRIFEFKTVSGFFHSAFRNPQLMLKFSKNPDHLSNNGNIFLSLLDDNRLHLWIGGFKPNQIPLLKNPLDRGFIFD
jgi:hypothetical protein